MDSQVNCGRVYQFDAAPDPRDSETPTSSDPERRRARRVPKVIDLLKRLGPGLVTGASDDDPSGIATYSSVGAAFGFGLLWTSLFSLPLMSSIQEISARVGRVTGRGIAGNIRRHYSRWLLYPVVLLLVLANTINIGADIGAMGDALALVIGGWPLLWAALFASFSAGLQIFVSYKRYTRYLKWLTLAVFSYVATAFMVHVPWGHALRETLIPRLHFSGDYWSMFIAILGTTISPYLFFWQASQETEEIENHADEQPVTHDPREARPQFTRIRFDTYVGMTLSNLVAFFIILSAAVTLHARGVTDIETSAQAAEALRPVAGRLTFALFSLGIVGTGLLAVPVLAGSAAYALGEALQWPCGLARKPLDAKAFYFTISAATVLGLALNFPFVQKFIHLSPMRALVWSAIINGIVAVPVMVVIMIMTRNPRVMGKFVITSRWLRITGWLATAVMAIASAGMFLTWHQ
jgi:NRAMP (natural resistance-associated macrophage protein)-like metal ion transporter